ncbi:hypothetical protein [Algoriphagus persicinus]|uniref:hypothetical protein n=1 Tax=Algoriphagus persicinus TaxID=3108754 RepID=UPI002B3BD2CC|nr:hypothetical protein [Algoriphagus sp. E1-3-M2]MEB2785187.1 hypothetical protein [Algoriphagus sp. E1-3-M2]
MVKLLIYQAKKTEKVGYTYFWKASFRYKDLSFHVLVADSLRANTDYRLEMSYYQKAGAD